jgi:phage gpG-like protein
MLENFLHNTLNDIKTELMEEFDKNFERKGFFSEKWADTKRNNRRGSLMLRSGKLRRSIKASLVDNVIRFSSSLPYAKLHNEGGKIRVTAKMKAYFWHLYYQATGGVQYSIKTKEALKTKKNRNLTDDAKFYKAMALKPIGEVIVITKRQFLGHHPDQDKIVNHAIDRNLDELNQLIKQQLKQKK